MRFFDDGRFLCRGMLLVLACGIIVRLIVSVALQFNNDTAAWATTISNIEGGNGLYDVAGYYYPPVWGYILAAFAATIRTVGIGNLGDMFPEILFAGDNDDAFLTSPGFDLTFGLMMLVVDLLGALALYWLIRTYTDDVVKAKIGFTLYFLAINIVFIGADGGMFDNISAFMTVLCVCLLVKGHDFLAGSMFAMAVLTKLFPVFLIFILVAYLFKKDRNQWIPRLVKSVSGAAVMVAILLLPIILSGNLMDSMTFVTSRAGAVDNPVDVLLKYSSVSVYLVILVLEALIAHRFTKKDEGEVDRSFLWAVFVSVTVIFIYPGAPQYIVLMIPFLVMATVMYDRGFFRHFVLLSIGSTVFMLSSIAMQLTTMTLYYEAIPFDAWVGFHHLMYDQMYGIDLHMVWGGIGGTIQCLSVLWVLLLILKHEGIDILERLSRKNGNASA